MANFEGRSHMGAWLANQPREAAVLLASRVALRALPLVQLAKIKDFRPVVVLPVFRANVVSWTTTRYPTQPTTRAAASAFLSAVVSASATAIAIATADAAAAIDSASSTVDPFSSISTANESAVVILRSADGYTAPAATRAAAAAARAAAAHPNDCYSNVSAIRSAVYSAILAGEAISAAAYSDARNYAIMATDSYDRNIGRLAAYAGDAVAPNFWSEISADATHYENGKSASFIARLPVWQQSQPPEILSLWQELEAELLGAKQNWQVWTSWYEDRLVGRVRDEELELTYVETEETLWEQGPEVVNAEIARELQRRTTRRKLKRDLVGY
ncbi:MAG TPA: hypothetical protein VEK34_09645 [Methylocella sp.]|nr:hypothetical protein [Methylocella sp.]